LWKDTLQSRKAYTQFPKAFFTISHPSLLSMLIYCRHKSSADTADQQCTAIISIAD